MIPCQTINAFSEESLKTIKSWFECFDGDKIVSKYDDSICIRNNSYIPLRLSSEDLSNDELNILKLASIGLKNFYPWNLVQENIGETKGLIDILMNLREELKNNPSNEYKFLKMDQNCYWRIQKVKNSNFFLESNLKFLEFYFFKNFF